MTSVLRNRRDVSLDELDDAFANLSVNENPANVQRVRDQIAVVQREIDALQIPFEAAVKAADANAERAVVVRKKAARVRLTSLQAELASMTGTDTRKPVAATQTFTVEDVVRRNERIRAEDRELAERRDANAKNQRDDQERRRRQQQEADDRVEAQRQQRAIDQETLRRQQEENANRLAAERIKRAAEIELEKQKAIAQRIANEAARDEAKENRRKRREEEMRARAEQGENTRERAEIARREKEEREIRERAEKQRTRDEEISTRRENELRQQIMEGIANQMEDLSKFRTNLPDLGRLEDKSSRELEDIYNIVHERLVFAQERAEKEKQTKRAEEKTESERQRNRKLVEDEAAAKAEAERVRKLKLVEDDAAAKKAALDARDEADRQAAAERAKREARRNIGNDNAGGAIEALVQGIDAINLGGAQKKRNEAAVDEKAAAKKTAVNQNATIDVVFPGDATFVTIENDEKEENVDAFVRKVLKKGDGYFEWQPLGEKKKPLNNTLRIKTNRAAVYTIVERVAAPLFETWATVGAKKGLVADEDLHVNYWINTVVPFLTQVALAFAYAQEQNLAIAEEEDQDLDDNERSVYNQELEHAVEEFKTLAMWLVTKALTGLETGDDDGGSFPGSTQNRDGLPRARSIFQRFDVFKENPTVARALESATSRNQLLRFDVPFSAKEGKPFDQWKQNKADQENGTFGLISTPILKMIYNEELGQTTGSGKVTLEGESARLFPVEEDGDSYSVGAVRFGELGEADLASTMSFLQRVYALPLLTALFLYDFAAASEIPPDAFNLQDLRESMIETYFAQMPVLPAFFQQGIETSTTKREGSSRPGYKLFVPSLRSTGKSSVLSGAAQPLLLSETFDTVLDEANEKAAKRNDDALFGVEVSGELLFVAAIHQLAGLNDLYNPNADNKGTFAKRVEVAHEIVADVLFTPFKINDEEKGEAQSFFERFGTRPRFTDPETKKTTFFQSASSAKTTVETAALFGSSKFDIFRSTLSKNITKYEGEGGRQIKLYRKWLDKKGPLNGALAEEIDDVNETPRTVLVPTDKALRDYQQLHKEKVVYDALLFNVLQGRLDFGKMLKERTFEEIETELKGADGKPLFFEMRVLSYSESGKGGVIEVKAGDRRTVEYSVTPAKYAKNGIWYIINGLIDPSLAVKSVSLQLPSPLHNVGRVVKKEVEADEKDEEDYDYDSQFDEEGNIIYSDAKGDRRYDDNDDDEGRRRRRNARRYAARLRNPRYTRDFGDNDLLSNLLGLNRRQVIVVNQRDFDPWSDYLYRTGTMAKIDAINEPVHLYVPTQQALSDANIVLSKAPASLGEAHTAIGRFESIDGAEIVSPVTAQELHHILQRDNATQINTLRKDKPVRHVPFGISTKSAARPENELHHDDVEFRDPSFTFASKDKPEKQIHVHFINRVLHGSLLDSATVVKSAAAPKPDSTWAAAHERTVKALLSSKDSASYEQHMVELSSHLTKLGGGKKILAQSNINAIDAQFKTLRGAVARNQFVDAQRKAVAHTAISQMRAEFN